MRGRKAMNEEIGVIFLFLIILFFGHGDNVMVKRKKTPDGEYH